MAGQAKQAVRSRRVYTAGGCRPATVLVQAGSIVAIAPYDEVVPGDEVLDTGQLRVIPGLIDVHNHGFRGVDVTKADGDELAEYTRQLASVGVTGVLATTGYDAEPGQIVEAMKRPLCGARILGIHSEGPFFSPHQMGVATRADGTLPDMPMATLAAVQQVARRCQGQLKTMTIAPEMVAEPELYRWLRENGIVIAGGHTNATCAEYREGIRQGVVVATHTGNAMRGIGHREVGALGAALLDEGLYCELIADFVHIAPEMMRLMFRVKPPEKFLLVSDSTSISGLAPGVYDTPSFGRLHLAEDGRVFTEAGRLAGSSLYVLKGLENVVRHLGLPLEVALRMTCENPAALLGLAHKGSLAPGKDADLVVLRDDYTVQATMVEGEWMFQAQD